MADITLVIGNKNYSSWSLRPWLALKAASLPFREQMIMLRQPDTKARILEFSASGKIPFLIDGEAKVWESLSICEYIAELRPDARLWPVETLARAEARSVATEMHAGFAALRRDFPMDICRAYPGRACSEEARADIARVLAIWRQCRKRFGAAGPYLFGAFGIADCMFAPVVTRLRTYGVELDDISAAYVDAVFAYPPMQEWCAAAAKEPPLPDVG